METVKISPKFQVVIPAKVRKSLNLKAGQRVRMIPIDGKIEVVPVAEAKSLRGFAKGIDATINRGRGSILNVLDSSGWLEYFTDDKHADVFEPVIENDELLLVPSICFYEVYKVLNRELGKSKALNGIALMANGKEVSVDQEIALTAAQINAENKLPMADSMIYAIALKYDAELWTLDSDFKGLPRVNFFSKRK